MNRMIVAVMTLLLCVISFTSAAQDQPIVPATSAGTTPITDDQVNAIAEKLYCPVCENITLDTCGTAACADWRAEIRLQLEQGRTEDEIVTDFVTRFGDRVVGTPQDSTLRTLALVTPWVLIAGVLLIVGNMILRRRRVVDAPPPPSSGAPATDKYQDLIEQDLEG
jgi:cytochrome c-type biogenesis protein CcmH